MAALGDTLYRAAGVWKRLTGNITVTKKFLTQTGDGAASAAPSWTTVAETDLSFTDVVTNDVTSTKHGFAPKSPADATKFLNGAATPAFALVKDSDLSTTDVVTNNAATTKHGFLKKLSNVVSEYMDGTGAWSTPPGNDFAVCEGRLTLTTATPVTTANVSGVTNVFFTPFKGNKIGLYSGSGSVWTIYTFTEKTLALGTLTNDLPYDVFIFDNSGTPALEALAWSTKTARATALVMQDGVLSKTGALTRRYLGTFHTTSTTTTEDSETKRLLYNYYNRLDRYFQRLETTGTWTYTTATTRQANGAAANQVEVCIGVAESPIEINVISSVQNSGAGVNVAVAIGEDSTTAAATGCLQGFSQTSGAANPQNVQAQLRKVPAVGWHRYTWLEFSAATGTTTWYGVSANIVQSGIHGITRS